MGAWRTMPRPFPAPGIRFDPGTNPTQPLLQADGNARHAAAEGCESISTAVIEGAEVRASETGVVAQVDGNARQLAALGP